MIEKKVWVVVADYLGAGTDAVMLAAAKAPTSYKRYLVRKRNGIGMRTIYHPSRSTKALQHAFLETLMPGMRVHQAAMAYRRGLTSPLKANASLHAPFRYSVRVDFRDFFPSIVPSDLFPLFEQDGVLGRCLDRPEREFVAHCCFVSRNRSLQLAVGAPSSPAISNAVMNELDLGFAGFAEARDGTYTRYADDLVFSSNGKGDSADFVAFVEQTLDETQSPSLRINGAKTWFMSRGTRRPITGLIVTPEGFVSLGRERKRLLRSMVHRYKLYWKWERNLKKQDREMLSGLLAFVLDVEPDYYNRLALKYGAEVVNAALQGRRRRRRQ